MVAARVSVDCIYPTDYYSCGSYTTAPLQVRIKVTVDMPITFLSEMTRKWLPQLAPIPLSADATLRYVH